MGYDTQLFIEIIESTPGLIPLRQESHEGIFTRFYQGLGGKLVIIECTDEEIAIPTCKSYLIQLGLSDLILSIFPEKNISDGIVQFNIGDDVFELSSGKKYKIVGDCLTPFSQQSKKIFPIENCDFVLLDSFIPENEIVHAKKNQLVHA